MPDPNTPVPNSRWRWQRTRFVLVIGCIALGYVYHSNRFDPQLVGRWSWSTTADREGRSGIGILPDGQLNPLERDDAGKFVPDGRPCRCWISWGQFVIGEYPFTIAPTTWGERLAQVIEIIKSRSSDRVEHYKIVERSSDRLILEFIPDAARPEHLTVTLKGLKD